MSEWQPIETAPKDGSWFYVRREEEAKSDSIRESVFRWDAKHSAWFSGFGWWHGWPMRWTRWLPIPVIGGREEEIKADLAYVKADRDALTAEEATSREIANSLREDLKHANIQTSRLTEEVERMTRSAASWQADALRYFQQGEADAAEIAKLKAERDEAERRLTQATEAADLERIAHSLSEQGLQSRLSAITSENEGMRSWARKLRRLAVNVHDKSASLQSIGYYDAVAALQTAAIDFADDGLPQKGEK